VSKLTLSSQSKSEFAGLSPEIWKQGPMSVFRDVVWKALNMLVSREKTRPAHLRPHVRFVNSSNTPQFHDLFSICLNLPAALGPGLYSASNRNEYQKQENNVSVE
jgi:hypothetical protein